MPVQVHSPCKLPPSALDDDCPVAQEHPIVFSQKSIRDIISGTKTVTRRVYRDKPGKHIGWTTTGEIVIEASDGEKYWVDCPYGNLGDLLWVRENWTRSDGSKGSARYMPKAKARLWLQITDITISKLGDMTDQDAHAEGYPTLDAYKTEWHRLNAKRGFPWRDHQLVWVLTFQIYQWRN